MSFERRPTWHTYLGLCLVTTATLMQEILFTRIFSVTMWYHFAFLAISVAMFGMTVGAILVYLLPGLFTPRRAPAQLALGALAYGLSVVACFIVYLKIPFTNDGSAGSIARLAAIYVIVAVPFVFSGITVAIALTKFSRDVGRLYAVDLLGAALGCVILIPTLNVAGGSTAVVVVGTLACLAAVVFALAEAHRRRAILAAAVAATAVLTGLSVVNGVRERENRPLLNIVDSAGRATRDYRYVRWNSHSRIAVGGDAEVPSQAAGWGLSQKTGASERMQRQLYMVIDTWAGTSITAFDGDTAPVSYLKDDVTNIAHYLRPRADVLVVGVGGGRDVLSALVFDQASVTGVEINSSVLDALVREFGDLSGHLDRDPRVTLVADEARSFITRSPKKFDLLQISLIDTWAATAAGAFVLAENALYTVEAWRTFLEHLQPHGILSVSRWYYAQRPGEALRIAALARAALDQLGVEHPRDHVLMVKSPRASGMAGRFGNGVVTLLVSPDPFSAADIAALTAEVDRLGFEFVLTPDRAEQVEYEQILGEADPVELFASYPLDITPPTDDRPFFFQMLRMKDFSASLAGNLFDPNRSNLEAIRLLGVILGIVALLTLLCVVVPLLVTTRARSLVGHWRLLVYFLAIGCGFMFVEISQMQRLMVMLGHPTYALSVVLFTLLVGTGLGSWASVRVGTPGGPGTLAVLVVLVALLVLFGFATPILVDGLRAATTSVRVSVTASTLLVLGFFLGFPFPLGMRLASDLDDELRPWLWGINGAASVLCSVLATVVALGFGIGVSFWCGVACYVAAALAYLATGRDRAAAA